MSRIKSYLKSRRYVIIEFYNRIIEDRLAKEDFMLNIFAILKESHKDKPLSNANDIQYDL